MLLKPILMQYCKLQYTHNEQSLFNLNLKYRRNYSDLAFLERFLYSTKIAHRAKCMHASHSRSFGIDNARVLTYALQHVTVSNSAHNKIHQADIISRYFRSAKQVSAWLVLDVCCLISTFFYVFYLFFFFFAFLPFQPLVSCTFVHLSLTINPLMDVLRYGDTPIR